MQVGFKTKAYRELGSDCEIRRLHENEARFDRANVIAIAPLASAVADGSSPHLRYAGDLDLNSIAHPKAKLRLVAA